MAAFLAYTKSETQRRTDKFLIMLRIQDCKTQNHLTRFVPIVVVEGRRDDPEHVLVEPRHGQLAVLARYRVLEGKHDVLAGHALLDLVLDVAFVCVARVEGARVQPAGLVTARRRPSAPVVHAYVAQ